MRNSVLGWIPEKEIAINPINLRGELEIFRIQKIGLPSRVLGCLTRFLAGPTMCKVLLGIGLIVFFLLHSFCKYPLEWADNQNGRHQGGISHGQSSSQYEF